jgi:phage terminase large subunit-like protein
MAMTTNPADELIRTNFEAFARKCFASLHAGRLLGVQPFVTFLCNVLSKVFAGDILRLIINLPPRHLKSFLTVVCFVAWWLGHRPYSRIMIVTYSEPQARELGYWIQDILAAPWYLKLFPTRISSNRSSVTDCSTIQGGRIFAVSVAGSLTGRGADLIIFDDPAKISDADNDSQLEWINDQFNDLVMTRRNVPNAVPVLINMHRLNDDNDLSGYLLNYGGWDHIALPFVAPEDVNYGDWHRKKGELLRPDAYDENDVARIRDSRQFQTLYQQCVGLEEHRLRPEHFGRFVPYEVPARAAVVLSVDASLCSGPRNSFSVIQAWSHFDGVYYLLNQWRRQCDYEDLWEAYKKFCDLYNPVYALIERAANGRPLIRDSRHRRRRVRVVEIATDRRSKMARLAPHLETIRAGRVKLPRDGDFVEPYIGEMTSITPGFFDQIDATAQFLEWIRNQPPLRQPPPRATGVALSSRGYALTGDRAKYVVTRKKKAGR